MQNFKIDSYYYNEHTKELQCYKGEAIYIIICYDNHPSQTQIKEMINDIEKEAKQSYKTLNQLN